jgi:CDP-glycerol glycerophosphotransferase
MQEACLKIGREKHKVTGYPRNDDLIRKSAANEKPLLCSQFPELSFEQVILYAPSWRHGREPTRFFPFSEFDPEALQKSLKVAKTLLLLRPHLRDLESFPAQATHLRELAQKHSQIKLATHQTFSDVNTILPEIDRLLTDYSALYHDFLLLDRPIGFIPYDYEDFKEQNGFLYDYFENLPGTHIQNAASFSEWIETEEARDGQEKRRRLRTMIHTHTTPDSCQRIAELLDRIETS